MSTISSAPSSQRSTLITIFASDSSKRSVGDSPHGLRVRVGWSTVWPASCVARFSPRTSLPRVGRSTRGFLSLLCSALHCDDFGVPFQFQRCLLCTTVLVYLTGSVFSLSDKVGTVLFSRVNQNTNFSNLIPFLPSGAAPAFPVMKSLRVLFRADRLAFIFSVYNGRLNWPWTTAEELLVIETATDYERINTTFSNK